MLEPGATDADFERGRAALLEITSAETIGDPAGSIDEGDGVISVYFNTTLPGYPGWRWTASIARLDGEEPTVLETELTPGEGALLAPDWVPWVDRLAEYQAAQDAAEAEAASEMDDEEDIDDADDVDDVDENDLLQAGDLDGVDIDDVGDDDEDVDDDEDDDRD
jgi:hypothetical protein